VKILQTQEGLSSRLDLLRKSWSVETVIHNDIKSDNILIRPGRGPEVDSVEARIVDWELVQLGDPAWDLAGALQDLLLFWVQSLPMAPGLAADQMMAAATYPLAAVQAAFRALWAGYRATAGLAGDGASALLTRAVRFSAPRMIQSAYEMSHGSPALPPAAVILLQIGTNILDDPELAQVQLYGLYGGAIL
jgi:aminoglycoside phosphotransferase (APT) family kinase protein